MKKLKCLIILLVLIISAPIVVADATPVYGGGREGGSSEGGSSGGEDPYLEALKCFDTGQFTFTQKPSVKPATVEKNGTNYILEGEWKGTHFVSEEAEIIENGTYTIHDEKNGDKSVYCPGLVFSCRLVKIDLQDCTYHNGSVTANFTLEGKGTNAEKVQFEFEKKQNGNSLKYTNSSISSELKGTTLQNLTNEGYVLTIASAPSVSMLRATYEGCIGRYYLFSKIACEEIEEEIILENETLTKKVLERTLPEKEEEFNKSFPYWLAEVILIATIASYLIVRKKRKN